MMRIIIVLLILITNVIAEEITVTIKGVDDGVKTNKQQDYEEAVMNAKLQAIERAGLEIKSFTKIENFKLKYDMIESKAEALLLPGFQIVDVGYQVDGTYQVVLVGTVKTAEEGIESKQLRYAKSLIDRGKRQQALNEIEAVINSSDDDNAIAEALFYKVVWNFADDPSEVLERLRAYYPDSKFIHILENYFMGIEIKKNNDKVIRIRLNEKDISSYNRNKVWNKNIGEESIELTDKDNKRHRLIVKKVVSGYVYYEKINGTHHKDRNYKVNYNFYINNKFLGDFMLEMDGAGESKGLFSHKVFRKYTRSGDTRKTFTEYPVKITVIPIEKKGIYPSIEISIETLSEAIPTY